MHSYPYIEKSGDLCSGLFSSTSSLNIHTLSPYYSDIGIISGFWMQMLLLSLFLLGLIEYCSQLLEHCLCCSPSHTIPSSLAEVSCSVFSTPEILSWPLKSGLGSPSMCSYSTAYLLYPWDDLLTCLRCLFFLWEETISRFLQHHVW